ncbi:MAG: tetratricopeptide repeat protein [Polyangiaceae bacterium]|nr:tetratricopeptide repeat protein [Polyangiaceae bacterium]
MTDESVARTPESRAQTVVLRPKRWRRLREALTAGGQRAGGFVRAYFVEQDPTFWVAVTPALVLAALIFVRNPGSNYIFDEQEALLANPYVNDRSLGFLASLAEAFQKDFWGLPPTRSIGSYRPIPNLIWRGLWRLSTLPWLHHWVNVVLHAVNASLLASFAFVLTRRRGLAWLVGGTFLCSAVLTEAVTGVVGIADVLGGFGVCLALHALRGPWWSMPIAVMAASLFGLLSKESCLVVVPLLPWVAFVAAPALHPGRPLRFVRPWLALIGAVAALVLYTEIRRRYFFAELEPETPTSVPDGTSVLVRTFYAFLDWFRQPRLPADPINNPLIDADFPHRVAGALRVFSRGVGQILLPWRLSGDYSFPQEPAPTTLVFPESVLGALWLVGAPLVGVFAAMRLLWLRDRRTWREIDAFTRALRAEGDRFAREWEAAKSDAARAEVLNRHESLLRGDTVALPYAPEPQPALEAVPFVAPTVPVAASEPALASALEPEVESAPEPAPPAAFAVPVAVSEPASASALELEVELAPEPVPPAAFAVPVAVSEPELGSFPASGVAALPPSPAPDRWWVITSLSLIAIGLVWFPVAYFPHSNIPVILPTVRAERFWYLPAIGTAMILGLALAALVERLRWRRLGLYLAVGFFGVQVLAARVHALHYTNDLVFWRATKWASPNSAKAHLNYSVMVGARGQLEERLVANQRAIELAPKWAMAHVYLGDTLCRLDRTDEAWPHYVRGFELANNDSNLIALGYQCLWDHGAIERRRDDILALGAKKEHQGSWLAWLGSEVVYNGKEHGGVPAKYRPRGYDQGPKE